MAKHFELTITQTHFGYRRKTRQIAEEAALDGLYAVRTSLPEDTLEDAATVRAYKSLAMVEGAFRCLKIVDLHVRPIHHWLEDRVRAHVFLCMLAYYVEWNLRAKLAPMLYDDDGQSDRRGPARQPRGQSATLAERPCQERHGSRRRRRPGP
jgi:hypothetical protein